MEKGGTEEPAEIEISKQQTDFVPHMPWKAQDLRHWLGKATDEERELCSKSI